MQKLTFANYRHNAEMVSYRFYMLSTRLTIEGCFCVKVVGLIVVANTRVINRTRILEYLYQVNAYSRSKLMD